MVEQQENKPPYLWLSPFAFVFCANFTINKEGLTVNIDESYSVLVSVRDLKERFYMRNKKNIKNMTMRERFDARGFSPAAYSKAYGVNRQVLYDIFKGSSTGISEKKDGAVRRIIAQLKKDKVWIGPLPWEG